MPIAIEDVRKTMPVVGDHLEKKLSNGIKQECIVTYVNTEKLWYQVTFKNGVRMCFKLPASLPFRYDHLSAERSWVLKQGKHRKVRVVETGMVYPTAMECARAFGVSDVTIRRCIYKNKKFNGEYTIVYTD